ncbi:bifunctional (p)ppGpp synthetase/guanosine-3',5'-bis(diphosphate) 3'-pyrophosphohydrolase [Fusobacterium necrophorum]|uniref:Bifunctional (P)ppGpp synthetase/guanosine-3',5'-bis(Diphosphate) 3'-pyrophosphohydrolase n=1 Tax=Fusobacterium necrophorum TaxID=859 RepID=A0A4Q2KWZ0_9FUSO|nr:bifunctional (p)ppGpp synthetase/guanosine-3',5'-bis(diphosphate) 3'-pyrophosphohydrolase [Fusobacterium necrophorum]RXZ69489.1 bifunctional (p)ppGpp synthetase/guanosine-3',5'-bis(diphosphate) 3'-pyrophosphohydrolase [Fusobacterium necrophorum]
MNYWDSFVECVRQNHLEVDIDKIKLAYFLAEESHRGQYRKSGEAYIMHPIEVAKILVELKSDTDTIIAAILHDIVEDTFITLADIEYNFGKNVAHLVDGVTKLKSLPNGTKNQSENIRKMILAMTQNLHVILIKLADRLHNMRTLKFMRPEKQIAIAQETLEVYAPLAHRLGIARIKWELEDLCLYYLHNDKYLEIRSLIDKKKDERKDYIDSFIQTISKILNDVGIKGQVKGRFKHFYSIYKKMYELGKEFDDIYDLMGVRIIVSNTSDCYHVLGEVHSRYTPVPGRFKDYIAVPKSNNYQSIHTTIVGPLAKFIEIQIRTEEMDRVAEEGVAAHWAYKEKRKTNKEDQIYGWLRNILDLQQNTSNTEDFVKSVTADIKNDTIFVFSPKGDILELPNMATTLDFAFAVHTQVGCRCIGAKVNGKIVPLDTKLQNGDRVEIITSKNSKGPSKDWLDIVRTHGAKSKIRKFLKDINAEEITKAGKESLEKELTKLGIGLKDLETDAIILKHMEKNNIKTMEEFYYHVGEKRSKLEIIISKLRNRIEKEKAASEIKLEDIMAKKEEKPSRGKNDFGIVIDGINNTLIRFAKCCTPLPGDEIGGYVTRLTGITVHRKDCVNYQSMLKLDPSREIVVSWDEKLIHSKVNKYHFAFTVFVNNRDGILMDVVNVISNHKIHISSVNTHETYKEGKLLASLKFNIEINDKEEYNQLINNISKIRDVLSIQRD